MSEEPRAVFDRLSGVITALNATQNQLDDLVSPMQDGIRTHAAQPFKAGGILCSSLTPAEQADIAYVYRAHGGYGETLKNKYDHHFGNSTAFYYKTYTHHMGYPQNGRLEDDACEKAFVINSVMTARHDIPPEQMEYQPLMNGILAFRTLALITEKSKETGEYDRVKDVVIPHQQNLKNYILCEKDFIMAATQAKGGRRNYAAAVEAYCNALLPGQ